MLQSLLADRFQMKTHKETKEISCYVLLPGKGPHKLKDAPIDGEPTLGGGAHGTEFHNQPVSRFTIWWIGRTSKLSRQIVVHSPSAWRSYVLVRPHSQTWPALCAPSGA